MILDFFKIAANLKKISRQGWIDRLSLENPESVADHSYSMAIISMVISDLENYNSEKILKMVLLHDLAESKIGDYTPEQLNKEKKNNLENNAFNEIIKDLPDLIKSQYLQIWQEYQENISPESKIVHQLIHLCYCLTSYSSSMIFVNNSFNLGLTMSDFADSKKDSSFS